MFVCAMVIWCSGAQNRDVRKARKEIDIETKREARGTWGSAHISMHICSLYDDSGDDDDGYDDDAGLVWVGLSRHGYFEWKTSRAAPRHRWMPAWPGYGLTVQMVCMQKVGQWPQFSAQWSDLKVRMTGIRHDVEYIQFVPKLG